MTQITVTTGSRTQTNSGTLVLRAKHTCKWEDLSDTPEIVVEPVPPAPHWAAVLWLGLFALLVGLAIFTSRASAQGTTRGPSIPTQLDYQQTGDTARFVGRWQRTCDAAGCADSVRLAWTLNGQAQPVRTIAAIVGAKWVADTVRVLRAWCPTNTTASLTITMLRRGRASASVTRSATMGCRDVNPPPVDSFAIDTGTVWRTALRVDSLPPAGLFWYGVTRADSTHAMVHVLRDRKTFAIVGAQVTAPTTCGTLWYHLGDTTSVRVAMARAAQWPRDSLTARATRAWQAVDYTGCAYCQVWQGRCG